MASPIELYLRGLYEKYVPLGEGEVATYIPELGRADPAHFGIALCTIDGEVYEVGDTRQPLTIQSLSKPFVYGMALEDQGEVATELKVGLEPSGDAFNAISLDPRSGRPSNPMINAGAIATTGLIAGADKQERSERIRSCLARYTGRAVGFDEKVYESERATGHRNRAIAHLLRNFNILSDAVEDRLDLYFRQCSFLVDGRDLAVMAASLANGGLNPVTGERALEAGYVDEVLGVMAACGMYDGAGEWIVRVGMPAKSGVSGGILAVLPGQLGLGFYSPRLDERGNSVRGMRACRELVTDLALHMFRPPQTTQAVIRAELSGSEVRSRQPRRAPELEALDREGGRIRLYLLQGELVFSTVEVICRRLIQDRDGLDDAVIDFKRVLSIDACAARMLCGLFRDFDEAGKRLAFSACAGFAALTEAIEDELSEGRRPELSDDYALALEGCERRLLERCEVLPILQTQGEVGLGDFALCAGLSAEQLQRLSGMLERRNYKPGAAIISHGGAPDALFFLLKGQAAAELPLRGGARKRLMSFEPGMVFGEMALIDSSERSADVIADDEVRCFALPIERFRRLEVEAPELRARFMENLALSLSRKLRRANDEIRRLGL